jgi:hypothetical protein
MVETKNNITLLGVFVFTIQPVITNVFVVMTSGVMTSRKYNHTKSASVTSQWIIRYKKKKKSKRNETRANSK